MNTRVFKDIEKYQNRVFLGLTFRQLLFVMPSAIVSIIVLTLNTMYWQMGDWFTYGFTIFFAAPLMAFGVLKPNDIDLEIFLKHFLRWHFTEPIRLPYRKDEDLVIQKKTKSVIRETNWEED